MALTLAGAVAAVEAKAKSATGIRSLATGRHGSLPKLVVYPGGGSVDFDAMQQHTIKHTVVLEVQCGAQDLARGLAATQPYVDALLDEFGVDEWIVGTDWRVESVAYEYAYTNGKDGRETLGPVLNITVYGTEDC